MTKIAVLANPQMGWNAGDTYIPGPKLEVHRYGDGVSVYNGTPVPWEGGKVDDKAGDSGMWFDFSAVEEPGLYYIYDPSNMVRSHAFEIGPNVYRPLLIAATKMFYFNRANVAKRAPFACAGEKCWEIDADALGPGQDQEARSVRAKDDPSTARDLRGGWWDAGDTNKYVTFAMDPFNQLLSAYQERPQVFTDDFAIPESGNGLPDIIDELMVEIAWLKRMQPTELGGAVLIKMGFNGFNDTTPDQEKMPRYYFPGGCSSSTISAAGMFAHAAVVFRGFPQLIREAAELKERAIVAWDHFHSHPQSDACDDGSLTGGDSDQALPVQKGASVTAAVYLAALTSEPKYHEYVAAEFKATRPFNDGLWSIYDQSQGDALQFYAELPGARREVVQAVAQRRQEQASELRFEPGASLYRAHMRDGVYHWGSNNQRAAYGNNAYAYVERALVPESSRSPFLERAEGMLHSFHGINAMQLTYLTNVYHLGADHCADEMFHAWFRDGSPIWDNALDSRLGPAPGYVTGGPNPQYCQWANPQQSKCANSPVRQQPAEKAYLDSNQGWNPASPYDQTWELSEPAIYYQASYVRLVSKFVN